MGFRFWRRIKIAPGLTFNLSKSGGSLSFGPRGAKFTVGSRGKRATLGLPETSFVPCSYSRRGILTLLIPWSDAFTGPYI